MLEASKVVQETFVRKIISVDANPVKLVENVPDVLASEIPSSLLVFSESTVNISMMNKKTWTPDQVSFDIEQLSPSVLQGFSCSSVQKMSKAKIKQMIRACRPRKGRAKVDLEEPQLTCMYNLIRDDLSQNFTDYPPDMLLYLDIQDVQKANCRSYFSALGAADFSVASSILNKGPQKFREARDCLGISGDSLSRDNVEVLGNMVCTLDRSDIENSDPLILENLKACKDLSASQVAAMETLLLSGKTQYGYVTNWDQQTLEDLKILPFYFTRTFWDRFTIVCFYHLEISNKCISCKKLMSNYTVASLALLSLQGCTEGNITQVTVSDPSFPFGYNMTQFNLCLDVSVLKDNLYTICQKVDDDDFQKIILKKLNQVTWEHVAVWSNSGISWSMFTAEKPVSQRYDVAKGIRTPTAFCPKSGSSLSTLSMNSLSVCDVNLSLNVESDVMSMNWSFSAELKPVGAGSLKGSLTQSYWELFSGKNPINDEICCLMQGITEVASSSALSTNSCRFPNESVFPSSSRLLHIESFRVKELILSVT
uniref:Uncharacterized protein n=1 Tax=Xiphophorus couchianus TaxID=32473 RepID=A0A3B5LY13_9TELE